MDRAGTDIFISGGGIAGLVAAAAMAHAGFSVHLADPSPPAPDRDDAAADLRSTAFLQPAVQLFRDIGLWPALEDHAVPLAALRVVDSHGTPPRARETRTFTPEGVTDGPFGWNIPNWLTRREIAARLAGDPKVTLHFGTGFASMLARSREARVTLTDGSRLAARLVIAADGRDSPVRAAAGIDTVTRRYGQTAFAFAAGHALPHGNVSTEIYLSGGAFTTVPLPDHRGRPASAIVWMNEGPRARALAALDDAAFDAAMTERALALLGPMRRLTRLAEWPVITRRATRMTAERTALVAEAAHVLPPIGAQGLNTSLHDVALLYDLARAAPGALGTAKQLDTYARARARDIALRARAIDAFNRLCQSGAAPVQALRRSGLTLLHDIAPLRHGVMRAGLGRR